MISQHLPDLRTAAQAGTIAIASLVAAHAWRNFLTSAPLSYAEHVTPAAWRARKLVQPSR